MDWLSWLVQWLAGVAQLIIGFLLGAIITGAFTWKVVLPKTLKNKEVQDLIKTVRETKKAIDSFFESEDWQDMVTLFREGKELLKELVENQKKMSRK
ncbi:hypothetical protein GWO13_00495 [Candidatus Bathyarchaeota archaeon]|nr:hypothetical protein [Candidatus Bathyarchaeota archaeon]